MPRTTPKKQQQEDIPMRKVLVALPEDVYKALKHFSVDHDRQMREVVAEALRTYLQLKGEEKKKGR
jgi:hypothetical protein